MNIPFDAVGYAVNPSTAMVHTRYAGSHAKGTRRVRTVAQVEALLGDRKPRVCRTCYPAPRRREQPATGG